MGDTKLMDTYLVFSSRKSGVENLLALFHDFVQFRERPAQDDTAPYRSVLLHIRGEISHEKGGFAAAPSAAKEKFRHEGSPDGFLLRSRLRLPESRGNRLFQLNY